MPAVSNHIRKGSPLFLEAGSRQVAVCFAGAPKALPDATPCGVHGCRLANAFSSALFSPHCVRDGAAQLAGLDHDIADAEGHLLLLFWGGLDTGPRPPACHKDKPPGTATESGRGRLQRRPRRQGRRSLLERPPGQAQWQRPPARRAWRKGGQGSGGGWRGPVPLCYQSRDGGVSDPGRERVEQVAKARRSDEVTMAL